MFIYPSKINYITYAEMDNRVSAPAKAENWDVSYKQGLLV